VPASSAGLVSSRAAVAILVVSGGGGGGGGGGWGVEVPEFGRRGSYAIFLEVL
jgi:hypothetical protein